MLERQDKELVVDLHQGLCFDEFGRAVTSLLEDLLYRTCHLELPVKHLHLVQHELTPRNKQHFEKLRHILRSVERLASTGILAEVVLLQGSTVPLAQQATHIRVQPALWDDNTPRCDSALRQSIMQIFRAVCAADLFMPKFCKSFLFVRLVPQDASSLATTNRPEGEDDQPSSAGSARTAESIDVEGFERRPGGLPVSRAKRRTVFSLRQTGEHRRTEDTKPASADDPGVWLQLTQHLPTVSCS
ncbi:hypothetical protein BIW11_11222 [Tropilaelaps mercedesae]|uniref:Uncharacterized protein n=1 Tax=Tropilaelaps mercedesae TaxID=418985 RepID=A0A1V9XC10_9ACAR|nr:hypothetical protein BIW11_11222 [Tropilaelaps mercedesae]